MWRAGKGHHVCPPSDWFAWNLLQKQEMKTRNIRRGSSQLLRYLLEFQAVVTVTPKKRQQWTQTTVRSLFRKIASAAAPPTSLFATLGASNVSCCRLFKVKYSTTQLSILQVLTTGLLCSLTHSMLEYIVFLFPLVTKRCFLDLRPRTAGVGALDYCQKNIYMYSTGKTFGWSREKDIYWRQCPRAIPIALLAIHYNPLFTLLVCDCKRICPVFSLIFKTQGGGVDKCGRRGKQIFFSCSMYVLDFADTATATHSKWLVS